MGQEWVVRPLTLRSNLEIILEEGVVIAAKRGEYHGSSDSVFSATGADNLIIRGYGATIRMHKQDYMSPEYKKAEWRMGFRLLGCSNVEIHGVTIRDTGGDAIYLGRPSGGSPNENIVIRDIMWTATTQGISVISRETCSSNSVFKNTSGTGPSAGIDLEPNHSDEKLKHHHRTTYLRTASGYARLSKPRRAPPRYQSSGKTTLSGGDWHSCAPSASGRTVANDLP